MNVRKLTAAEMTQIYSDMTDTELLAEYELTFCSIHKPGTTADDSDPAYKEIAEKLKLIRSERAKRKF